MLRRVPRSIPDTIHAVSLAVHQFATAALHGEFSVAKFKKKIFDLACDVISNVLIKLCNLFGHFMPGAITYYFRGENRSSSLADRPRGDETPPSSAGRSWKYLIGARVKVASGKTA